MENQHKKIAIIGCGNLGLSILNGLISSDAYTNSSLTATRRNLHSLEQFSSLGITITSDNLKAVSESEIILVALKPYKILEVLGGLSSVIDPKRHTLVSMATGVTIDEISSVIGKEMSIYRAMPNTAANVSESLTCICSNQASRVENDAIFEIFNSIGKSIHLDESLMESATVLGACGIAYVLRFIRGMIQGGIEIGFDAHTASAIVNQTVKGAAELLIQNQQHPEHEIDKVTTPKGCTIAGLNEMEHNGFSSALIKGIVISHNKIEK